MNFDDYSSRNGWLPMLSEKETGKETGKKKKKKRKRNGVTETKRGQVQFLTSWRDLVGWVHA